MIVKGVSYANSSADPAEIAIVTRSGRIESTHTGTVLGVAPDKSLVVQRGDTCMPILPRSANKPMQATALLEAGIPLRGPLLALAAGSHAGEPFHVRGVQSILGMARLPEDDLQCPPDLPSNRWALFEAIRQGDRPRSVYMNCSGKHAAMLLACVLNQWPTDAYCNPEHPLQQHIMRMLQELASEIIPEPAIDGCGAPLYALTPSGLVHAFLQLVHAPVGTAARHVADAIRNYAPWASGTSELDHRLMAAVPELLLKSGAEGVLAFAHPSGAAGVIKIHDGSSRALGPVAVTLLEVLGLGNPALAELAQIPITGGSDVVGHVQARTLI